MVCCKALCPSEHLSQCIIHVSFVILQTLQRRKRWTHQQWGQREWSDVGPSYRQLTSINGVILSLFHSFSLHNSVVESTHEKKSKIIRKEKTKETTLGFLLVDTRVVICGPSSGLVAEVFFVCLFSWTVSGQEWKRPSCNVESVMEWDLDVSATVEGARGSDAWDDCIPSLWFGVSGREMP